MAPNPALCIAKSYLCSITTTAYDVVELRNYSAGMSFLVEPNLEEFDSIKIDCMYLQLALEYLETYKQTEMRLHSSFFYEIGFPRITVRRC